VEFDTQLDYAVLRVSGDPGRKYSFAPLIVRNPRDNESLFVFHHPSAIPLRLTRSYCRTTRTGALRGIQIRHKCDTQPGSSGAPMFELKDQALAGIHTEGGLTSDASSYNQGVSMAAIIDHSKILALMQKSQQKGLTETQIRAIVASSGQTPETSETIAQLKLLADLNGGIANGTLKYANTFMVFFNRDSFQLGPSAAEVLDEVEKIYREVDGFAIVVEGNTDTALSENAAQVLSQRTASAVAGYLVSRGIQKDRILVRALGKTKLLVQTADGVSEPLNRRVEIYIAARNTP
jgi:outer membrane protein OmpA-like peptidoglycan-associated protein